jgi:ABC-2 type transport system permease protein
MTAWTPSLREATKFQIVQHARNTFALILVLLFIPSWLSLIQAIIPSDVIEFGYRPADEVLSVDASRLAMVSGAINAVTLIVGFMMFAAVRRSGEFDQRLVLAGYSRSSLLVAKLVALGVAAGVVAAYATVVMYMFWGPRQSWLIMASLLTAGLVYGGIGVALGVIFRSELPGMFLIIMISLVDVMIQNPIINPASDTDLLILLPTYGAMQTAVGGAFTNDVAPRYLLVSLQWLAALAIFGLVAFYMRTRDHHQRAGDVGSVPHRPGAATVIMTSRDDGSLVVRSTTGAVMLCSRLTQAPMDLETAARSCRCSPVGPPA